MGLRWADGAHTAVPGCQVEGGRWDGSEGTLFSGSHRAICSNVTVFQRRHVNLFRNSFAGQTLLCKSPVGVWMCLKGGEQFTPSHWWEQEKNMAQCVCMECSQDWPDACEESGKLFPFQMGGSGSQARDVVVWSKTERRGEKEKKIRWFQLPLEIMNKWQYTFHLLRGYVWLLCHSEWNFPPEPMD